MRTLFARHGVDNTRINEVISAAHRHFVRRARSDPDGGWLLVRM
jgi:hypothetical protein